MGKAAVIKRHSNWMEFGLKALTMKVGQLSVIYLVIILNGGSERHPVRYTSNYRQDNHDDRVDIEMSMLTRSFNSWMFSVSFEASELDGSSRCVGEKPPSGNFVVNWPSDKRRGCLYNRVQKEVEFLCVFWVGNKSNFETFSFQLSKLVSAAALVASLCPN